jgi:hypothetical protein
VLYILFSNQEVSEYDPGKADIDREFTSVANKLFVLHDSKGFEPGDEDNFDIVRRFVKERSDENLDLRNRLHAVWSVTFLKST